MMKSGNIGFIIRVGRRGSGAADLRAHFWQWRPEFGRSIRHTHGFPDCVLIQNARAILAQPSGLGKRAFGGGGKSGGFLGRHSSAARLAGPGEPA